ncbi:MAG: TRAP transporter large permease subunit [Alphaproteobacteria bacterium]|nr:TRAP transporter large permease subunit [Alphaproteobacteria bacterium]
MELFFLALLILTMAGALALGFPVAFALPGSAILTIGIASLAGVVFAGDVSAYFSQDGPVQWLTAGVTNFRGIYWEVERDTLIAVPLFVFMGIMLQRSKVAEDLLVAMAQLFGPVPGGLGISVVLVGALLAATTGILGATVVAMGLISLPAMLRNNYSKSLAAGTVAAAGTLGQIIPPSIVLIILADQLSNATDQAGTLRQAEFKNATGQSALPSEFGITSTSAGDMFLGAFLPGLVLVGLYVTYILITALIRPQLAPAVPREGKFDLRFAVRIVLALVPPLTLIFAVLGSIILGIATVNQAGAIGAIGAMIMAGYRLMEDKRGAFTPAIIAIVSIVAIGILLDQFDLNIKNIKNREDTIGIVLAVIAVMGLLTAIVWSGWRTIKIDETLKGVMVETAKTTSMVFIILLGAAMLTAAFRSFGGEILVKEFLTSLPGGFWTQFIVVMAVIFFLGFFLDFIEIAVVVVPIVAPILLSDPAANITAVWLGVMIGVNMQTSFLTPPFGFALFYLRGVAPIEIRTLDIYRGVIAFILLQLVGLGIAGNFPSLVNFLPNLSFLTAETAPPPRNPRLQQCLEQHVFAFYEENGDDLRTRIQGAMAIDISFLPEKRQRELAKSFDLALGTFELVTNVRTAEADVQQATVGYRPLHLQVRKLQKNARDLATQAEDLSVDLRRLKRRQAVSSTEIEDLEKAIAALNAEQAALEANIPDTWEAERKQFVALLTAEKNARRSYRRNVDRAYEPLQKILNLSQSGKSLATVSGDIEALEAIAQNGTVIDVKAALKSARSALSKAAPDTSAIRSLLTKGERALRPNGTGREKTIKFVADALKLYAIEVDWRQRAAGKTTEDLVSYNDAIKTSIGVRLQDRLPSNIARSVAVCRSKHRDISLNF